MLVKLAAFLVGALIVLAVYGAIQVVSSAARLQQQQEQHYQKPSAWSAQI